MTFRNLDLRFLASLDEKLRIDILSMLSVEPKNLEQIIDSLKNKGWIIHP